MNIKLVPLGSFVDINPESITKAYPYDEIQYIDISSVGSGHLVEIPKVLRLIEAPSRAKRIVRDGDTILATVRPNLRSFLFVQEPSANTVASTGFALLRAKKNSDPRFIYYAVTDQRFTGYLTNNTKGTSYPAVDTDTVLRGEIPNLTLPQQKAIATTLSAYDDLIENNRRRIQLLEQAARLLYKEWFVHLRFPGHEHTKIQNGIPEGWEKTIIGNVSSFIARGITPKYDDDAPGVVINQKCIRDQRLNMELARHQSKEVNPNKLLRYGDVLVNSTGEGTLGRVAQFLNEIEGCTVDSHITIARPADGVPVLLYGQQIMDMQNYLSTMGRGATNQTELSKDVVSDLPFLRPPHLLTDEFESKIKDISKQVTNLTQQNVNLAKARDLLLPRLMNGEVTV